MRNSAKGFTKVRVDNIHSLSLIDQADHLVSEGDHISQAGPAFHKPTLTGPYPLVVLEVPWDGTQDDLLNNFP